MKKNCLESAALFRHLCGLGKGAEMSKLESALTELSRSDIVLALSHLFLRTSQEPFEVQKNPFPPESSFENDKRNEKYIFCSSKSSDDIRQKRSHNKQLDSFFASLKLKFQSQIKGEKINVLSSLLT